jgi:endonuclease/exonuclease/phosphatase family metal-dependent hydrolase
VRILTWNLWWRFGPWEDRLAAIVATVRALAPDVVCLQEVWTDEVTGVSSASLVAEALGHPTVVAAVGFTLDGIGFGNAVTSRWPLVGSEVVALPALEAPDEQRRLVVAVVDADGEEVAIGCTHLNWRLDHGHVRVAQAGEVLAALARHRRPTTVLCGDLNAEPDSDEIRLLTGRAPTPVPGMVLSDTWRLAGAGAAGLTWDNRNPFAATEHECDRRIDYVLQAWSYPGHRHAARAALVGDAPVAGTWPSDHLGIVVDLVVSAPA